MYRDQPKDVAMTAAAVITAGPTAQGRKITEAKGGPSVGMNEDDRPPEKATANQAVWAPRESRASAPARAAPSVAALCAREHPIAAHRARVPPLRGGSLIEPSITTVPLEASRDAGKLKR